GQRQRICLARAIIKRPSLLILDEPTSAIDAESTRLIQNALDHHQVGKTMIVISHQFSGIENFDRILVLRAGRIVESGDHRQLLERGGYYRTLYQAAATSARNSS
ncbi:MAG: ATP-binding cassette domain-containing protein, partial [Acidobacteriota bacterium]